MEQKQTTIQELILHAKTPKIILKNLLVKPNYVVKVAREENVTISRCSQIAGLLVESKIVEITYPDGRTKLLTLTSKGKEIAMKLNELQEIIGK